MFKRLFLQRGLFMLYRFKYVKFNKIIVVLLVVVHCWFFGSIFAMIQQPVIQFQQPGRPVGLGNSKNACYINAAMQVLFGLPQFWVTMNSINNDQQKKNDWYWDSIQKKIIAENPFNTFIKMYCDSYNANNASPAIIAANKTKETYEKIFAFKDSYLSPDTQYDTGEVFSTILHLGKPGLHVNGILYNELQIFFPLLETTINCDNCKTQHTSLKERSFPVSIEIPTGVVQTTLKDCVDGFLTQEVLGNDYVCDYCQKKGFCKKQLSLTNEPGLIFFQLKRFHDVNKKIEIPVDIPLIYSASVAGKLINYNLLSIIFHTGTLNNGHYTALVKYGNNWYLCDDGSVTQVLDVVAELAKEITQKNAYFLMYTK